MSRKISETTVRRLSLYLRDLEERERRGVATVSSEELAEGAGTTAAQVRKDLSHFGSFGKRGLGYSVAELSLELREILGLDRVWRVALVGAGRIGSALFEYAGFEERGFRLVAVLDKDPEKVGTRWGDVVVCHADRLEEVVRQERIQIAILAIPAGSGQEIAERAVRAGVRGIMNFAPTQLRLPEGVALKDVNLVLEMEALSFALVEGRSEEGPPAGAATDGDPGGEPTDARP